MKRVIENFTEYMAFKLLNNNQVTVDCGLAVGLLGKSQKGDFDLGRKTQKKILKVYTDINPTWLVTGDGPMLISNLDNTSHDEMPVSKVCASDLMKIIEKQKDQIQQLKDEVAYLQETNHKLLDIMALYTQKIVE